MALVAREWKACPQAKLGHVEESGLKDGSGFGERQGPGQVRGREHRPLSRPHSRSRYELWVCNAHYPPNLPHTRSGECRRRPGRFDPSRLEGCDDRFEDGLTGVPEGHTPSRRRGSGRGRGGENPPDLEIPCHGLADPGGCESGIAVQNRQAAKKAAKKGTF